MPKTLLRLDALEARDVPAVVLATAAILSEPPHVLEPSSTAAGKAGMLVPSRIRFAPGGAGPRAGRHPVPRLRRPVTVRPR